MNAVDLEQAQIGAACVHLYADIFQEYIGRFLEGLQQFEKTNR